MNRRQQFYTDFGKNIRVGRNVFVNHACEFMDRGGITIGDDVLIGPKVNLVTINHPLDPARRRATYCAPIVIERGAWLGAAVSVMPGVTIGENAVVAANADVSAAIRRSSALERLHRLAREAGALGTDRAVDAALKREGR